jgi:hypothetical protein
MSEQKIVTKSVLLTPTPKVEAAFTVERLEEHHRQRDLLKKTGKAKLVDIHGTTIHFTIEDTKDGDRKVLRVKDDLEHSASEEIGPEDAFLTWYNPRFLLCEKYPNHGDNYSEIRKIQRYCPFEIGVWKNVPVGVKGTKSYITRKKLAKTKICKCKGSLEEDEAPPPYSEKEGMQSEPKWAKEKAKLIMGERLCSAKGRSTFFAKTCKFVRTIILGP